MTKLNYTIDVNVAKTGAWKILADFANLDWTKTVKSVHYTSQKHTGVGTVRHCELSDGGYIVERITQWEEGSGYVYIIDDARDPVSTDSYVTWHLSGDERRCKITFEVNYRLKYGILGMIMNVLIAKRKFSKQISMFMEELKTHLEIQDPVNDEENIRKNTQVDPHTNSLASN